MAPGDGKDGIRRQPVLLVGRGFRADADERRPALPLEDGNLVNAVPGGSLADSFRDLVPIPHRLDRPEPPPGRAENHEPLPEPAGNAVELRRHKESPCPARRLREDRRQTAVSALEALQE